MYVPSAAGAVRPVRNDTTLLWPAVSTPTACQALPASPLVAAFRWSAQTVSLPASPETRPWLTTVTYAMNGAPLTGTAGLKEMSPMEKSGFSSGAGGSLSTVVVWSSSPATPLPCGES